MRKSKAAEHKPLLIVDGYNVIMADPRYQGYILSRGIEEDGADPFEAAREALIADVAAFAGHSYEPVVVFDAAGNISPERPNLKPAGVALVFSPPGKSADEIIETYVTRARRAGRTVLLVTSDGTIRATAGFGPGEVRCLSSALFAREVITQLKESQEIAAAEARVHLTLSDRLAPELRERLSSLREGSG